MRHMPVGRSRINFKAIKVYMIFIAFYLGKNYAENLNLKIRLNTIYKRKILLMIQ